jgi:hypothetical protein
MTTRQDLEHQIALLTEEQERAKMFLNDNGFNCTTAPWIIVKRYRDDIKQHLKILHMNLEDFQ